MALITFDFQSFFVMSSRKDDVDDESTLLVLLAGPKRMVWAKNMKSHLDKMCIPCEAFWYYKDDKAIPELVQHNRERHSGKLVLLYVMSGDHIWFPETAICAHQLHLEAKGEDQLSRFADEVQHLFLPKEKVD